MYNVQGYADRLEQNIQRYEKNIVAKTEVHILPEGQAIISTKS